MRARGTKLRLLATLLLFGAAVPLRAQAPVYHRASLAVCNKGSVPVEVVVARKNDLFQNYYEVEGTTVAPGACETPYSNYASDPVYIAFGFADSKGQWGSGKIAQVPDFGNTAVYFRQVPVLSSNTKGMCARKDETHYAVENDLPTECASFQPPPVTIGLRKVGGVSVGHGPFLPLASALYFLPIGESCYNGYCNGGEYYLNISPSATERELHAARGTKSGANFKAEPPVDPATARKQLEEGLANLRKLLSPPAPAPQPSPPVSPQKRAQEEAAARADANMRAVVAAREQEKWKSPMFPVSAYEPQWIGKTLVLKGTVSRVEVESDGEPHWVHIYFKESPDATVTACSPYPDMLREMFGNDFSRLTGKAIEMAGVIEKFCKPNISIRLVEHTQIRLAGTP